MDRTLKLIGIAACLYAVYLLGEYLLQNYTQILDQFFYWAGIVLTISLLLFGFLRWRYGKNWMLKTGTHTIVGGDLVQAIDKTLEELPKPERSTIANLGGQIIYRFTRIAIVGLLLAIIPVVLLFQQNKKLDIQNTMVLAQNDMIKAQNELIDTQNGKIDVQNSLSEANRRSSLVFLMSNILDNVGSEIAIQRTQGITDEFSLSVPLRGRIIALSKALKPYQMLDGDTLSNNLVSPERSQLFIALMESDLDMFTQYAILRQSDFSYATIGEFDLSDKQLAGVNLSGADLSGAKLWGAILSGANLSRANLSEATLIGAELQSADLSRTNFNGAILVSSNMQKANLSWANLENADLREANLEGANFGGVNLLGADLSEADLKNSSIASKRLSTSIKLHKVKNLDPKIDSLLRIEKPCLFTEEGCITE